jgi:DeoR/GlpR family transcriptional regulator of sugar metabolism
MVDDESDEEYFVEKASDEEILEFVKQGEVVTTKEVAEHFGYHLQSARRRLKALEEKDELEMKDVGKRLVWWIPKDES